MRGLTPFCVVLGLVSSMVSVAAGQRVLILEGNEPVSRPAVDIVNLVVGAGIFYNAGFFGGNSTIANVEAGHIWGGHEVFDRSALEMGSVPSLQVHASLDPLVAPQLGDLDYHATAVGHVLAGTGYDVNIDSFTDLGAGMAPLATLWSGAIATEFDAVDIGAFSISDASFIYPYKVFFSGSLAGRPDVINSSWGSSTASAVLGTTRLLDALAYENPTVASVVSAGNSGEGSVGQPAAGLNQIAVGSLQAVSDPPVEPRAASDFTSRGLAPFYNPETEETILNARTFVHLAAPGENQALAFYGGDTGSLTGTEFSSEEPATDLYFNFGASGTSFAAPVVAGGIALLKEVAKEPHYHDGDAVALDARVIRSVLMAGATATAGWDNAQVEVDGVISTAQALDPAVGAGMLNLERAAEVYFFGTAGVGTGSGGIVDPVGWDFGSVTEMTANDYRIGTAFAPQTEVTVALNWFARSGFDAETDTLDDSGAAFVNLDLELWRLEEDEFAELIAISGTVYNSAEFLRVVVAEPGFYGFRVVYQGTVYDLTGTVSAEDYALAWHTVVVPEPAAFALLLALAVICGRVFCRRRAKC